MMCGTRVSLNTKAIECSTPIQNMQRMALTAGSILFLHVGSNSNHSAEAEIQKMNKVNFTKPTNDSNQLKDNGSKLTVRTLTHAFACFNNIGFSSYKNLTTGTSFHLPPQFHAITGKHHAFLQWC